MDTRLSFQYFRSLQYFMSKEKRNAKANIIKKKKKKITKKKYFLIMRKWSMKNKIPEKICTCKNISSWLGTQRSLYKNWSFPLRISSVNVLNPPFPADLVIFTEEILNGRLFVQWVLAKFYSNIWILHSETESVPLEIINLVQS